MNSFPFNLNGPDFLLFYGVFGVMSILGHYLIRVLNENGEIPKIRMDDPFLIAYLRGGKNEVLRLATISLVEKEYLQAEKEYLEIKKYPNEKESLQEVELELAEYFRERKTAVSIFSDPRFEKSCEKYKKELERLCLIPDETNKSIRSMSYRTLLLLLIGTGIFRITMSILHGKYNVIFLAIMIVVFFFIFRRFAYPIQTIVGKKLLNNLQETMKKSSTYNRVTQGQMLHFSTSELLFFSAVMGGACVGSSFLYAQELYPKTYTENSFSSSSSCGSSCGSSSSCSSGDSGCGSGCGGGCGGGD